MELAGRVWPAGRPDFADPWSKAGRVTQSKSHDTLPTIFDHFFSDRLRFGRPLADIIVRYTNLLTFLLT